MESSFSIQRARKAEYLLAITCCLTGYAFTSKKLKIAENTSIIASIRIPICVMAIQRCTGMSSKARMPTLSWIGYSTGRYQNSNSSISVISRSLASTSKHSDMEWLDNQDLSSMGPMRTIWTFMQHWWKLAATGRFDGQGQKPTRAHLWSPVGFRLLYQQFSPSIV